LDVVADVVVVVGVVVAVAVAVVVVVEVVVEGRMASEDAKNPRESQRIFRGGPENLRQ